MITGGFIYRGTGRIVSGNSFVRKSQLCWKMSSGGCRSSVRFQCANHCNVPFRNLEATTYVHIGPLSPHRKGEGRLVLTTGGPGQSGKNCCVYSLGFTQQGHAYAEEEGAHSPHPHISKMPVIGGEISSIGPLANRTIGLKNIIWHDSHGTHVQGWVDYSNRGQWHKFYDTVNPHGANLPVITHSPMVGRAGEQEARVRIDNHWPVSFDISHTNVREIAMPVRFNSSGANVKTSTVISNIPLPTHRRHVHRTPARKRLGKTRRRIIHHQPVNITSPNIKSTTSHLPLPSSIPPVHSNVPQQQQGLSPLALSLMLGIPIVLILLYVVL